MSNNTMGIVYMLISSFFFACMNLSVRLISDYLSPMGITFLRSVSMVVIILAIYVSGAPFKKNIFVGKEKVSKAGGFRKLMFRAMMGSIAMMAIFYNIVHIPIGTAVAFAQSAPLYVVLLSYVVLKEKVSKAVKISTIMGFVGIILISNPDFSGVGITNVLAGILSGVGSALAFMTLRSLKGYYSNLFIALVFGFVSTFMGLAGAIIIQDSFKWVTELTPYFVFMVVLLGGTGTLGQIFLNKAYMAAPAAIVSSIDYSRVLWSMILGIMAGDEYPTLGASVGIVLIIISGIGVTILDAHKRMFSFKNKKISS